MARAKAADAKGRPLYCGEISDDKYSIQDLLTHKVTDTHVSNTLNSDTMLRLV